ncbi:MAG: class A beta-lactamase-related serine hydrolase [Acidobacteria bacterium]|nr:class A beta-lactamase-related serine hydrolase [Acidobacteriota bacterium]MCA1637111.1 class A beta-lactamase-related serine hydrolase [Acidobacteriota bacterium]
MKKLFFLFFCSLIFCFALLDANAQTKSVVNVKSKQSAVQNPYRPPVIEPSPALQTLLNNAVGETINKFSSKGLKSDYVAATLIDLREPNNLKTANFRGEQKIYPASVVKMFYMVALHRWLEDGKVKMTPELERGLKDMIVDSSNEATQYILDVLTDTSSGGELPPKEFKVWSYKRNAVNRYFTSLGYERINVNQKTFCEDAYGREQQFRNYKGENRNMLTTNATARLLAEIVLGKVATPERSKQMMDLMKRDFSGTTKDQDDQAHGFTAIALNDLKMTDAKLWSKAGWTSKTRHDAAYIGTPDGLKFVLVVFTENMANERDIIPSIARNVLQNLGTIK